MSGRQGEARSSSFPPGLSRKRRWIGSGRGGGERGTAGERQRSVCVEAMM